jgi:hypothetical protein
VRTVKLPERGTGKCRTSPYSEERYLRNIAKSERNRKNRIKRAELWGAGKEKDRKK